MSVKLNHIIQVLEEITPKNLAEPWDNVGLQLGDSNSDITKILLTLDVTKNVVREAIDCGADVIISHHPFIFKGLKTLAYDTEKGRMIKTLIQNEIAIYVAHTNLDKAEFGLNHYVAEKLGLIEITSLVPEKEAYSDQERPYDYEHLEKQQRFSDHGLGKIGNLPIAVSSKEWINVLKKNLELEAVFGAGMLPEKIKRVSICTGAGSDLMGISKFKGADVFITGDLKYHDGQRAEELGLWVINAGHFGTEKWVCEVFEEILQRKLNESCPILIKSKESKGFFEKYQ